MARARRLRLFTTAAIGAVLLLVVSGCDWLQPGFSGGRDNANPFEPTLTESTVGSLAARYTLPETGRTYGSPIVVHGTLYVSSSSFDLTAEVSAFRVSDGAPLWTTTVAPAGALESNVAFAWGLIFVNTAGTISALDAHTGAVRWTDAIPNLYVADPAIDRGKLFVATQQVEPSGSTETGSVIAIDPRSGSTLWTSPTFQMLSTAQPVPSADSGLFGPLLAANGYVSVSDWSLALAPNNLEVRSFHESDGSAASITGQFDAGIAADGLLYGFSTASGTGVWVDPASGAPVVSPAPGVAAVSHNLAIGDSGQGIAAYNPRIGVARWTTPLPPGAGCAFSPDAFAIAGKVVYVVASEPCDGARSMLYTFDAARGTPVSAVQVPSALTTFAQLVVAEGTVFVIVGGGITAYAPTG